VAPGCGVTQRHHFGVRTAHGLGVALTDHLTAGRNQHATHSRVGCAKVLGLTGKFKSKVNHCVSLACGPALPLGADRLRQP
jgi:hypothetical protein